MSDNATLTDKELDKVYLMYESYHPDKLGDFIRALWKEAYHLGREDERERHETFHGCGDEQLKF